MERLYFELYRKSNKSLHFWSSSKKEKQDGIYGTITNTNVWKVQKNQLRSCMKDISRILISTGSQYKFYHVW